MSQPEGNMLRVHVCKVRNSEPKWPSFNCCLRLFFISTRDSSEQFGHQGCLTHLQYLARVRVGKVAEQRVIFHPNGQVLTRRDWALEHDFFDSCFVLLG